MIPVSSGTFRIDKDAARRKLQEERMKLWKHRAWLVFDNLLAIPLITAVGLAAWAFLAWAGKSIDMALGGDGAAGMVIGMLAPALLIPGCAVAWKVWEDNIAPSWTPHHLSAKLKNLEE